MRNYFHLRLTVLLSLVALILSTRLAHSQPVTISGTALPKVEEKLVLRLLYAESQKQRAIGEKRIGFYERKLTTPMVQPPEIGEIDPAEGPDFYRGILLATDNKRQLYFYDPITFNPVTARPKEPHRVVRVFNARGREVQRWWLPPNIRVKRATVMPSGIIWLGVEDESFLPQMDNHSSLPVMAYRLGQKLPVCDWVSRVPRSIEHVFNLRFKNVKISNKQKIEMFSATSAYLRSSSAKARIRILGLGGINGIPRLDIVIEANSKGEITKVVLDTILKDKLSSTLSPSGREYYVDNSDSLTFWWAGSKRGYPLLSKPTLTNPNGWWKRVLSINYPQDNLMTRVDGIGDIFLICNRWPPAGNFVRRHANGGVFEMSQLQTCAVVILNTHRQALAYLPWKTTLLRPDDEWIFPVPDGSGFYRQEFTNDELRIYWHPLPNFKQTSSRKIPRKKR